MTGSPPSPAQPLPVLGAWALALSDPRLVAPPGSLLEPDLTERERLERLLQLPPFDCTSLLAQEAVAQAHRLLRHPLAGLEPLAAALVEFESGQPRARLGPAWEAVSQVLDPDLLVLWQHAARPFQEQDTTRGARLDWPPILSPGQDVFCCVLERPMAETHAHLGGALPIACYWAFVMHQTVPLEQILPGGILEERNFRPWIRRLQLASALLLRLLDFWQTSQDTAPQNRAEVDPELRLQDEELIGVAPRLRAGLRWLYPLGLLPPVDPTDPSLAPEEQGLLPLVPERRLLWELLHQLRRQPPECWPAGMALDLLQYLRIRNAFHQLLLFGPGPRGLTRFQRIFDRRAFYWAPARGRSRPRRQAGLRLERQRLAQVVECYLRDIPGAASLASSCGTLRGCGRSLRFDHLPRLDLELRITPGPGRALLRQMQAWARGLRDVQARWPGMGLRVGFILQFHKRADEPRTHAAQWTLQGVLELLRAEPALRPLIVGLDVAGPEAETGPRTYSRLYRYVRRELDAPGQLLGEPPIRLGCTYHVGEDFRSLFNGLRHIDEAAHLLGLKPNDRLGHALALAWDPERFQAARSSSCPNTGEVLLDLLWAWALLREVQDQRRWRGDWAREQLSALLSRCGGHTSPERLEQAIRRLDPDGRQLELAPETEAATEEELLGLLGVSAEQAIQLEPAAAGSHAWLQLSQDLQPIVQQRVCRKNLVIEVNPTSNLLIGDFDSYAQLPYERLCPIRTTTGTVGDELRLSLNTDDPGLFQTSLRGEYQRYGRALLEHHPVQAVIRWIDAARTAALESCFIPPWAPVGDQLLEQLERLLPE